VTANEPFQKLINQGMILGISELATRLIAQVDPDIFEVSENDSHPSLGINVNNKHHEVQLLGPSSNVLISADAKHLFETVTPEVAYDSSGEPYIPQDASSFVYQRIYIPIEFTSNSIVDTIAYSQSNSMLKDTVFVCKGGFWQFGVFTAFDAIESDNTGSQFKTEPTVEKMSKSKYNVVNPTELIDKYGADALRLYEMFLGPLEQFKPWNTNGISGVATFLKKFWRLFHPEDGALAVTDEPASPAELKALHKVIQKVAQDVEKFSFNTSVSTFMIAVNELTALGTRKRAILEPLVILLSPFAPHLAEELWEELGHYPGSISYAQYPEFREEYLVEANVTYPVAINGKVREQRQFAATATAAEIEATILESDFLARFAEGKTPKKVVVVPGRMVNVVV
jgi:leucyl-tRNA synthetase